MTARSLLSIWVAFAAIVGSAVAVVPPTVANAQVISARCSKCGSYVPTWSRAGNRCPVCNAYWSYESTSYVPGGGGSSGSGYQPPFNPFWARFHEALRQRELRRQERAAYWSEVRENQIAQREDHRAQLIEQTEQWRDRDDPEQRADRYLKAARNAESEGNLKAATCYYRLITRALPDTLAAGAAATALTRVNSQ